MKISQQQTKNKGRKQKTVTSSRRNKQASRVTPLNGRGRLEPKTQGALLNKQYEGNDFEGFSSWRVLPASTQGGLRIKGKELIGEVRNSLTTIVEQQAQFVSSINPSFAADHFPLHPLACPRLANFAPVFEFYRFHTMKLNFIPSQNLTTNGTLFLGVNMEADDLAPNTIARVMGNMCSSAFAIYSKGEIYVPDKLTRLKRFVCDTTTGTGSIVNQEVQAKIGGRYAGQGVSLAALTVTHFMYIEYDIEFYVPSLDPVTPVLKKTGLLFNKRDVEDSGVSSDDTKIQTVMEASKEDALKRDPNQSIASKPKIVSQSEVLVLDTKVQDFADHVGCKTPCSSCGVKTHCGCIRKELNW